MMHYPPYHTLSENSFSETVENLLQLRRSLLELFRNSTVVESCAPRYSLFSSKRTFRREELTMGLVPSVTAFGFSKN